MLTLYQAQASLVAQMNLLAMQETVIWFQGQDDLLEKWMATLSNIIAWRFPWTERPGRSQSMDLQRIEHNLVTKQQQL